ncbi:hypothetical protein [Kitasatospora sp. NPDC004531]
MNAARGPAASARCIAYRLRALAWSALCALAARPATDPPAAGAASGEA